MSPISFITSFQRQRHLHPCGQLPSDVGLAKQRRDHEEHHPVLPEGEGVRTPRVVLPGTQTRRKVLQKFQYNAIIPFPSSTVTIFAAIFTQNKLFYAFHNAIRKREPVNQIFMLKRNNFHPGLRRRRDRRVPGGLPDNFFDK